MMRDAALMARNVAAGALQAADAAAEARHASVRAVEAAEAAAGRNAADTSARKARCPANDRRLSRSADWHETSDDRQTFHCCRRRWCGHARN